ncbi:MAG: prenyltransferase/squalene oxidase repeat-containing protein [Planctomycetota bacterium]
MLHSLSTLAYWGLTSTTWLALWSVLAVLTVVLVILLRTRWSQARPWRKCAILSLWVHVLLGCVATTVRIVTGAPELGDNEPIRVSVTQVAMPEPNETIEEITPEWEQPSDPPLVEPRPEPIEVPPPPPVEALKPLSEPERPTPAPPLEAPALLEALAEEKPPEPEETVEALQEPTEQSNENVKTEETSVDAIEEQADDADIDAEEPDQETPGEPKPSSAPPNTEATPLPSTYADRFAKDRDNLVQQRGGSEQTEQAVRAALGWLATAQSENGGWDASRYGAGTARVVLSQDRRGAGAHADMGVTGLALLAFLGAGHTHNTGAYTHEVAGGLEYLRQRQRADGSLFDDAQFFARMYCHSMATFAVCEALALTQDERLEPMARAAVRYTLSMQHPTDGGWRYQRGDTGDTSQLGWQIMTLKSAQLAGIDIPQTTWTRVDRFLRRVKRGRAGGLAAYRPNSAVSRSMTAEALFCRLLQREQQSGDLDSNAINEAVTSVAQTLPSSDRRNLYFWYYATLALHRCQQESSIAAETWEHWNHALTTNLLTTQQSDGSWDANTTWGGCGGRVYTTALSALCLEVYYRYNPDESPKQIADRDGWHGIRK